ncbi:MAG: hypothetical protein ACREMA_17090, partial [Longimicrobiales bacterium]
KTMRNLRRKRLLYLAATTVLLACGDAQTTDDRGYTKAPLERPRLLIQPEGSSAMDSLGTPILPRDTVIAPPMQTGS